MMHNRNDINLIGKGIKTSGGIKAVFIREAKKTIIPDKLDMDFNTLAFLKL